MATEDITSGADVAPSYALMRGSPRRREAADSLRTGLEKPADVGAKASPKNRSHGFNLPGRAEDHCAPAGVYSAERALDRYGGDGDDDGGDAGDHEYR